ncbi:MAG: hypothetical protein P9X24_16745 [Candidatus Hatepunaea meridiana]|nr:hypothetical protein [Candidatus Hatepunaea meridiana]
MIRNNPNQEIQIQRALISSWRKDPAVALAKGLVKLGVTIVASGGTANAIAANGVKVERLSEQTGFDNLLGGRVKTLHPAVYAAILARRNSQDDISDLSRFNIEPIDLVAVDLYPFPERTTDIEDAVELIDIGGVSLIRAAAKNFKYVTILCKAEQFDGFDLKLENTNGIINPKYRQELAIEAFNWTSQYDARIYSGLSV